MAAGLWLDVDRIKPTSLAIDSARLTGFGFCNRYTQGMATTRGKGQGGRPSKGDRRYLASRVPESLAQAVYDAADERGITVSDYIADLLAAEHGHRPVSRPVPDQKELAISA